MHEAISGSDPPQSDVTSTTSLSEVLDDTSAAIASEEGGPVIQRRRGFAHYLSMVSTSPAVVDDASAFREALWSSPVSAHDGHALVAGHWAARDRAWIASSSAIRSAKRTPALLPDGGPSVVDLRASARTSWSRGAIQVPPK